MERERFETLLNFFKVLGNESRLKALGLLANRERSVGELAEMLDLKEPTISHHLSMMKELGLVAVRAEGNVRFYRLETKALERMSKDLFSAANLTALVDETTRARWEEKVLQNFMEDGRIKTIPAQYKKQRVLLQWMVEKFRMDVRYSEREVNEIIRRYHPDAAWFRRSLVAEGFMEREKGVYWRPPET